jgi:mRNA interferase MazF
MATGSVGLIERGDVVWVDLRGAIGAEKQKTRPCVVVQNNVGNARSPLTIVVPITNGDTWRGYPHQVMVYANELWDGAVDSVIDTGHIRSIDKDSRISSGAGILCRLGETRMIQVDRALQSLLGLPESPDPLPRW